MKPANNKTKLVPVPYLEQIKVLLTSEEYEMVEPFPEIGTKKSSDVLTYTS